MDIGAFQPIGHTSLQFNSDPISNARSQFVHFAPAGQIVALELRARRRARRTPQRDANEPAVSQLGSNATSNATSNVTSNVTMVRDNAFGDTEADKPGFDAAAGRDANPTAPPASTGRRGQTQAGRIHAMIAPAVAALGYELVGVEFSEGRRRSMLRVYIDAENGVNVDDCASVSRQVSSVLDVEDPVAGEYDLEVSSPGLDRPLFESAHFVRFAGERARVSTHLEIGGQRNFTGVLGGVVDDEVIVQVDDGTEHRIPLTSIRRARLVPQW